MLDLKTLATHRAHYLKGLVKKLQVVGQCKVLGKVLQNMLG